jgi:predicted AAA+ superfamily ATPase
MENLILEFQQKLRTVNNDFERYLIKKIDLQNRLIVIKGARGAGKTTLLLQLAKFHLPLGNSLYVSLDHIYFYKNTLYDLAKDFELYGGKYLLLDEVHKYPNWSREIKLIYDNLPALQVVFTSSSLLQIYKSESDLSRRAVSYHLKELSLREFIALETNIILPSFSLEEILNNHQAISSQILDKVKPLPLFKKYLNIGAYPFFIENEQSYIQKLQHTINLVIETDIIAVEHVNYETLMKLKKLLITIASSVPFTPNISKLSLLVGVSRNVLISHIKILQRAGLIIELYKDASGIGVLTKPEKLYVNNTNLMFALAHENTNVGTMRETFFINQFQGLHTINLALQSDFLINQKYTFEVGGKNKTKKQIKDISNAYVAKDNIEIGFANHIPLWVFGLMY